MNTEPPHDIISNQTFNTLPRKDREKYIGITNEEAEFLKDKTEEERAAFLAKSFKRRLAELFRLMHT